MDNVDEMDKFLETKCLPRPNHEKNRILESIYNQQRYQISNKETKKNCPGPDNLTQWTLWNI